jgi:hypothetical protein
MTNSDELAVAEEGMKLMAAVALACHRQSAARVEHVVAVPAADVIGLDPECSVEDNEMQ